jgi:vacuolar-type H+-ATPase subunit F/Vma7
MDLPLASRPAPLAAHSTRIVALGSAALMDGFRLAGAEVHPDATRADLERVLQDLMTSRERALVLVENGLACDPGPWLARARAESGRIVVVHLPPLNRPGDYRHEVDRLVDRMAGEAGEAGEAACYPD